MLKFVAALGFLVLAAGGIARAATPKDALTVDLPNDVATMDPQLQWDTDSYSVYRNIFDNLVTRDTSGKIVPQIATAWHYVNDKTIVFDLRRDVHFQDGSKLTPGDVVFSIARITNPAFHSPQLSQFDQITAAEVSGPAQVTLHTKVPYPVLLAQLVKLSTIPKAYVQKVGDQAFNEHPIGSGPYKLHSWQRGVQTALDADPSYWRGRPPFRTVTFRVVPDEATRVADLRAGRADIIRQLTPDDAQALKSDQRLQVLSTPTERLGYLFVNTEWGPGKDLRVRQAIAMAIDRNAIISALLQGYGKPVNEMLTPASFGYSPDIKPWPFDPKRARALVKEAGAVGATLPFLTSPAYDRRITEAIQQMLGDVGLKVTIVEVDQPTFLRDREGTPAAARSLTQGRWSCACQDADGTIWPLFHSGSILSKYSNPAFDRLVDAARGTLDTKQRLADYARAFVILHHDVPAVPLYQDYAIYGAGRGLHWTPTPNEAFFIMDMSWR
ncbi:MAG: ABC transporter substrate-binding protein [Acetobacteraceae bacterium]